MQKGSNNVPKVAFKNKLTSREAAPRKYHQHWLPKQDLNKNNPNRHANMEEASLLRPCLVRQRTTDS